MKATTLWRKQTFVNVYEKTSAEVNKLSSEPDSAAACHHEFLGFIRRVFKTVKKRKEKKVNTLVKRRKMY